MISKKKAICATFSLHGVKVVQKRFILNKKFSSFTCLEYIEKNINVSFEPRHILEDPSFQMSNCKSNIGLMVYCSQEGWIYPRENIEYL